jgi:FkbM family methyltransferase
MGAAAVRRWIDSALLRLGYVLVPAWRMETLAQSDFLGRLFKALDIDCVIDVGANRGQFRDYLRANVGYRGSIVSFEPIPEHVDELRARARSDPRWRIEARALGAVAGRAYFNVMMKTGFSSFLEPDHRHAAQWAESNRVARRVEVEIGTLDVELPLLQRELGFRSPYLKLDTQGYDLEVVRGGRSAMPAIAALQTEASIRPIYKGMPTFDQTIRELQDAGFEVSGVFPTNYEAFPQLLEIDCHMVARRLIPTVGPNLGLLAGAALPA